MLPRLKGCQRDLNMCRHGRGNCNGVHLRVVQHLFQTFNELCALDTAERCEQVVLDRDRTRPRGVSTRKMLHSELDSGPNIRNR